MISPDLPAGTTSDDTYVTPLGSLESLYCIDGKTVKNKEIREWRNVALHTPLIDAM